MKSNAMFDTSKIVRIPATKPSCFDSLVLWWRKITKRDRYCVAVEKADERGKPDYWCESKIDTKTGVITVLRMGRGQPPKNAKSSR